MTCRSAREARPKREFRCCQCGRNVMVLVGEVPEPPLCAACPGWLNLAAFRAAIDEGTIREPDYTALPTWRP